MPESSAESSGGAALCSSGDCRATASVADLLNWAGGAPALQFLLRMTFDSLQISIYIVDHVSPVAREKEIGMIAKRRSPTSPGRPGTNRGIPNTGLIGIDR